MEWYKIVLGIFMWIAGLFLYSKYKGFHYNKYYNDSWKNRRKK